MKNRIKKGEEMKKILLDTNMFIYFLDHHVLDPKVEKLTRMLFDSEECKIIIHPKTIFEAKKIQDSKLREIFISKLSVYKQIDNPPRMPEGFNVLAGCKNDNDRIDNEMLYTVERNCVSFFVTNDKELLKKANKLNLNDRVLSIDEALEKFKREESITVETPVFIQKEYLYNMDLEDEFFTSLRIDYKGFDNWFNTKKEDWKQAYVTRNKEGKITSFLMLKEEDEYEDYSLFEEPFESGKRIKVSTFKVSDRGKKIGECFIKIMVNEAIKKNVDEIYVTTFEKQDLLINLLEQYGFKLFTYKTTPKGNNVTEREAIYVKNMKDKSKYPYIQVKNQGIFIFPIIPKYHKLLFEDAEREYQISITDIEGRNTSANAIKKAFISNSKIKKIKPGDILLFYASHDKKAITTLGIVETTWNKFDSQEEIFNIVRKRTAYDEEELKDITKLDSLVIMFKHHITFENPITYEFLFNKEIVNGYIQAPTSIEKEHLEKIVIEGNSQNMIEII